MQFTWTELEPFALALLGLVCTVMGWILRSLYEGLNKLRDDLVLLQTSLPDMYARRDDVKQMEERIIAAVRDSSATIDRRLASLEARGHGGHGGA